jgi:penicillin-binding protein 1A
MRTLFRSLGTFVVTVVIGGIAVGACLAALIPGTVEIVTAHHYTAEELKSLRALSEPSTVYYDDGVTPIPCGKLGIENRDPITSLSEVPKPLINAVIATEDRTFWTNPGIDLGSVFRAFLTNVTSGRIEQGGSTITQQLVKKRILSDKRDVNRKIKEIEDAIRLNRKFSKQKILTEYLNTVYFGENSYGIKSAAERFFTVPWPYPHGAAMSELDIAEDALLAGLINNPVGNDPFLHPDIAQARRADVLRAEVETGYITQAQADAANKEPLPTVAPPPENKPCNYLVAQVRDELLNDKDLGATADERRDTLLKGGLKIVSTFDPAIQADAEQAAATHISGTPDGSDWQHALVAIDPSSGAVRAMVGGPDFNNNQYNIATHPVGRQPGSTWKVITLAGALKNGYSPNDTVDGTAPCSVPKVFPSPDAVTTNAEGGGGGVESIWSATAGSINCAFVRLSTSVGQPKLIQLAHQMGIMQARPLPTDQFLTLSIGTVEATPLEMATVIATVADNGVHHTPYFVATATRPDGRVIVNNTNEPGDQVLDTDVAQCEQNVLRGVITGGTGTAAALDSHTAFGKTGTTDAESDAWFIGATPQLATAVWFGNTTAVVSGAGFGGNSSAPTFKLFMDAALAGQPDLGLPPPGPVCSRPGAFVNPDGGRSPTPVSDIPPVTATPTPPVQQTVPRPQPTTSSPRPPVTTLPPPTTSPPPTTLKP